MKHFNGQLREEHVISSRDLCDDYVALDLNLQNAQQAVG